MTLTMNNYQDAIKEFDLYPPNEDGDFGVAFGLLSEAGEIANLYTKAIRGDLKYSDNDALHDLFKKEIGDVLWYVATLARRYEISLEEVASLNIEKLTSRKERGVLRGDGDNR